MNSTAEAVIITRYNIPPLFGECVNCTLQQWRWGV